MISDIRLSQIIAVMTELSEKKKQDLFRFLLELKSKTETVVNENAIEDIRNVINDLLRALGNKVDKVNGKGLSSNDFTNELREKLVNIKGNYQANWNTTDQSDPSYIANKPDLSSLGLTEEQINKINNAVQKETGKGLSSNDFTDELKQKLDNLGEQFEQEQADWGESDNSKKSFIKNKPDLTNFVEKSGNKVLSDNNFTDELKNKLDSLSDQIQSDWNQTDPDAKDYIKNKPTIPVSNGGGGSQIQSDWNQTNNGEPDFIKNKPTIPDAQIQSDWSQNDNTKKDFIKNKPSIPNAQIQSDWNQTNNSELDFIKNKPTIPDISNCEVTSNKVTSLSSASTDTEYPSAKCVYDIVGNIEATLNAILGV